MADQTNGPLADAARTIGNVAGQVARTLGASGDEAEPKPGLWQAEYVGSGTFLIKKPKRQARKLRQSRLKGRRAGMRR